ncbi:MAG: carboxypeptidase regulatory-like domain-containing protein [Acidobacteriaceae bacterium]|nr:carboxypeptidase regulatory-like domain-containing protein [Acidobacteriaceae bacterium]
MKKCPSGSYTLVLLSAVLGILVCPALSQSTSGRVLGRVADPTGAVLAGVKVTLTNQATGVSRSGDTSSSGDYNFVEVQPGTYSVSFEMSGFKRNIQKDVIVDVNQVVTLNSTLQIGQTQETVEVTSAAPQVDTTSTQLGAVINDRSVNELPLNQRDTYQFLQLQPGVQSQLGGSGSLFYGSDSAGSVSVNGGRGRSNNFSVNGGDANDQFVNLPTVQPTPDSIEEFRVITNTFDAEYGRNSGAVVNVITKSGTNQFHGDIYEYFRNKVLNAQGYFNTIKPQFNQNQFGGTFGGPIKKDQTFFFVSYEGRRIRQGASGAQVIVPTAAERTGDFSGTGGALAGGISDPFVASVLNGRPGCSSAITAAGGAAAAAGVGWNQIFPTGIIPAACQDPVAVNLMQRFIPTANVGSNIFQAVPVGSDFQDQFTIRFDHKITTKQSFTAYYYYTDDANFQPFSFFQAAGANIPGFGSNNNSRYQQVNLSHTWTIGNALVNEARFTYMREGQRGFQSPQTTNSLAASCTGAAQKFCFTGLSDSSAINALAGSPSGNPKFGITPNLGSSHEGVPFTTISGGAVIGNNFEGQLPQVGNTFQWSDNLTWVKGNHTMKFGADVRRSRFDQTLYFNINGAPVVNSSGTNAVITSDGDNYAGYLLGLMDSYTQGAAQSEAIRSTNIYPFAEDSWKIKPNLTLNYGLRWEFDPPLTDVSHHVQTFRPGQNSAVYPCMLTAAEQTSFGVSNCLAAGVQPTGLVFPGDKGVPAGLTQTYYKAFAPRVGLAYSPNFDSGVMGKLFGSNGKTSIRTGWGMFYNPMEQLVMEQFGAEPPFGGSTFLSDTFFNTPFVAQNGTINPNPYNGILHPTPGHAQDWSSFRPIELFGEFQPHMRTQYTTQYNLNIERQLATDLMLQLGYVGSQGHRLLASHDINPSNPQTCLDMSNISQFYAASNPTLSADYACGPTLEDTIWTLPANSIPAGFSLHMPYGPTPVVAGPNNPAINLVGLRPYSSPNCNPFSGAGCPLDGIPVFTDIFAEDTIANSAYNAFEAMLEKRFSHGLQFQAAYTFSRSIDQASSFEETLNPFDPRASRALSVFNSAQRFVVSYFWNLPIPKHAGWLGKIANDWAISGITEFQSGFPIRLTNDSINAASDTELINSFFFTGTEAPQRVAPFNTLNPKANGGYWFSSSDFASPPLGHFNTGTQRTICCGPGLNNTDFSVHKQFAFTESKYMQFRAEIFNIANHTQFVNPDGNFGDGALFGKITQARDPRLVQFALKLFF